MQKSGETRVRHTPGTPAILAAHWMCCPKCGGKMAERKFENVMVDQCGACGGIYFDAGELDMLIKHEKAGSTMLGRIFGRA